MSNDTVVVPEPPPKPMLSIPVIPHEQICHAQHIMTMMEAQEINFILTAAMTAPIGALRVQKLLGAVSKIKTLEERLARLIDGNNENDRLRSLNGGNALMAPAVKS